MQTVPRGAGGAIPRPLFVDARRATIRAAAVLAAFAWLVVPGRVRAGEASAPATTRVVHASWYGHEFANRPTASGERFDPYKLTCAHRTLPLGTRLRVTNLQNGRSIMVRINDRGPYVRPRELDLSYGAARALGMVGRGVTRVRIEPAES
jgi:peptidoglycan lytic transglycosylase